MRKKLTIEQRKKISDGVKANLPSSIYKKGHIMSEEIRKKISKTMIGQKKSIDWCNKRRGENNHFWRGGVSGKEQTLWLNHCYRAQKFNNGGNHTLEEWINLKKMSAYLCALCGESEFNSKLTRDHIIPLSKGGSNDISNIQPVCKSCNSRKRTTIGIDILVPRAFAYTRKN